MKELGFKQESFFFWSKPFDINEKYTGEELEPEAFNWLEHYEMEKAAVCSAYTVAELGLLIPIDYWNCQSRTMNSGFSFHYGDEEAVYAETEADARAKLLIDLKTNKLI